MTAVNDMIEVLGFSQIQHGTENNRIYLMKYDSRDQAQIIDLLDDLACKAGYTKVFAKIPQAEEGHFRKAGYQTEARIPRFACGREDYVFMGKYFDDVRSESKDLAHITQVLSVAQSKAKSRTGESLDLPEGMHMKILSPIHTTEMAQLYALVFETYPFPIHDPAYLLQTMEENIIYFGIFFENRLIALSSSETDIAFLNSEMTDFAILPAYRGQNFSLILLHRMEEEMRSKGYKMFYTIARAMSYGMNATFAKADYIFGGTLINNTNISGTIESMNIWYKDA